MSDYFGKNHNRSGKQPLGSNPWQQDPFMAYDDPSVDPSSILPSDPEADPAGSKTSPDPEKSSSARPDFSAMPSSYTMNPLDFGGNAIPSSSMPKDAVFSSDGSNAATRIAHSPFIPTSAKRDAAERESTADVSAASGEQVPSQTEPPVRHRRANRTASPAGPVAAPESEINAPSFAAPKNNMASMPDYDPFEAGDNEASRPSAEEDFRPARASTPVRRPATPGERYSGARTALPRDGAPARRMPPASREAPEESADYDDRPAYRSASARPSPTADNANVRHQAVRTATDTADTAPTPFDPRRKPRLEPEPAQDDHFVSSRPPRPETPASVTRPRYDFEDEEDGQPPERGRKGVLMPILVVLLVIGGLLAAILLPHWENMNSGLGTAMGKIKSSVTGVFDSVKNLIVPEQAGIQSFSVSPASATAPVDLVFTVQASSSATSLRILDQNGQAILQRSLDDSDSSSDTITKNSNFNIWVLHYACNTAYNGLFTVQSLKRDGTWDEGTALIQPVTIAAPVVLAPPIQKFEADATQGTVPVTIGFTIVTSTDVTAVQIVNDYGDVVAEAYLNDAGNQVTENADTREWSLSGQFEDEYAGSFHVSYERESDIAFTQSDYGLDVTLTAPEIATDNSASKTTDDNSTAATGADASNGEVAASSTPANTANKNVGLTDENNDGQNLATAEVSTPEPTDTATPEPTEAPTATPSPEPTATPEPTPVTTPEPTPVAILTATADDSAKPSALKLTTKAYDGLKLKTDYSRDTKLALNDPFKYAMWDQSGVLTFRGGSFHQNAASGTVEIQANTLSELWKVPMEGAIKAKTATLTGVSWPGQPLIVKWPTQLRSILGINADAKATKALKEVIVGSQNGNLYFLDLVSGAATRDPIKLDWPSNGVLSLQTDASPMLSVGQHISVLAKKTIDNGLHLFNLLNGKELALLSGRDKLMQTNYSGFNSAPLFDMSTGAMIVGGENGLLYTMEPKENFDHVVGTLKIDPSFQRYSWKTASKKAKDTNIDGAIAMYGPYAYFADQTGILQCVDVNTLTPVWAADTGDNVDATVALDMENASTVALYTGNTILNQGRAGVCTIRRYDALTGKQTWAFQVPDLAYTTTALAGCYASPVVGQNSVSDLVFFTVTNGEKGATLYALDKGTGAVKWTQALESPTVSSPVAVYNTAGDAWLIQAQSNGKLMMMNAKTGEILNTLQLEGNVESSPAVYRDVLVICTTGAGTSYIYGIKLQ